MVAWVAENIGQKEGEHVPGRPSPTHHIPVGSRTLPEVQGHQLEEGQKLHPAHSHTQSREEEKPKGEFGQTEGD